MIQFCNSPILLFALMCLATLNLFKRVTASAYPFAGSAWPTQYLCSQVVGWMKVLVFLAAVWPCITHGQEPYQLHYCDNISWNNYYDPKSDTYNYTINLEEVKRGEVCITWRATEDNSNFKFMWIKESVPFTYLKFYKNNHLQCEFPDKKEWQSKTYSIKEGDELKWVFGIMSSVPKGSACVALPPTVTTPCPSLNIIVSNDTHCINQTNMRAEISGIRNATYYQWSVTSGDIVSGQGTPSILWNAGDNDTVLEVDVLRSNGAICSYRKVIPVNRTCVYLNCHDNINNHIENNTQIRLSGGCRYEGDVKIEGIHDLSITPAVSDSKPEIVGRIQLGNSSRIRISGVNIITPQYPVSRDCTKAICTDRLNDSIISDNTINSSGGFILLNDSFRITVKNNIIQSDTINCLIGVKFSENIHICEDNIIYNRSNLYRIAEKNGNVINICIVNQSRNCYSCNATDIRSSTTTEWGILNGFNWCE